MANQSLKSLHKIETKNNLKFYQYKKIVLGEIAVAFIDEQESLVNELFRVLFKHKEDVEDTTCLYGNKVYCDITNSDIY
jgi:hypothetical protein